MLNVTYFLMFSNKTEILIKNKIYRLIFLFNHYEKERLRLFTYNDKSKKQNGEKNDFHTLVQV